MVLKPVGVIVFVFHCDMGVASTRLAKNRMGGVDGCFGVFLGNGMRYYHPINWSGIGEELGEKRIAAW